MYLYFYLFLYCLFSVWFLCYYLRAEISEFWVWAPSDWSKSVTEVGPIWQIWFLTWAQLFGEFKAVGIWVWGSPAESAATPKHHEKSNCCSMSSQTGSRKYQESHIMRKIGLVNFSGHFQERKTVQKFRKRDKFFSCQINQNLNSEVQSKSKTWLCRYILFLLGLVHGTLGSSQLHAHSERDLTEFACPGKGVRRGDGSLTLPDHQFLLTSKEGTAEISKAFWMLRMGIQHCTRSGILLSCLSFSIQRWKH